MEREIPVPWVDRPSGVTIPLTIPAAIRANQKFIQEVQNRLKTDLEENGLMLESVSILTLRASASSFARTTVGVTWSP